MLWNTQLWLATCRAYILQITIHRIELTLFHSISVSMWVDPAVGEHRMMQTLHGSSLCCVLHSTIDQSSFYRTESNQHHFSPQHVSTVIIRRAIADKSIELTVQTSSVAPMPACLRVLFSQLQTSVFSSHHPPPSRSSSPLPASVALGAPPQTPTQPW